MRIFPPDLSSCAGKYLLLVLSGERQWTEGSQPALTLGSRRWVLLHLQWVGWSLTPQPIAVGEGLCCSPSSALPAAGITAPFCIHKHKPLTARPPPSCLRGRDPNRSHSVSPCGQLIFHKCRSFLTFGELMGCLGVILRLNNPLFLVSPSPFLVNARAVTCSPTHPDPASQFPTGLLSSFLLFSFVTAGILISKVHI